MLHIDIDYDPERVSENKKRWDAAFDLRVADRPPVTWGAALRLMFYHRKTGFNEFFNDPIQQLTGLILNWKWMVEHLPGDLITERKISIQPQFENVSNASAFGATIRWFDNMPPQIEPLIHSIDELKNYQLPPLGNSLWDKMIEYYHAMRKWLDDGNVHLTMRGEPVEIDLQLHTGGESPFCIATDLCGTKFYEYLYEEPDAVHRFLSLITDRLIETELKMRDICGFGKTGKWFHTDDSAQIISLNHFREFVVPYTNRIYDTLTAGHNERIMHLCGRHIHLYPAILDDLKIHGLWGYGSLNKPEEVRDAVGGKIWLLGNLDPVLLHDGPVELIQKETIRLLDNLLPCGGIIIADGYNLIPETPMQHLQSVLDTVKSYCK